MAVVGEVAVAAAIPTVVLAGSGADMVDAAAAGIGAGSFGNVGDFAGAGVSTDFCAGGALPGLLSTGAGTGVAVFSDFPVVTGIVRLLSIGAAGVPVLVCGWVLADTGDCVFDAIGAAVARTVDLRNSIWGAGGGGSTSAAMFDMETSGAGSLLTGFEIGAGFCFEVESSTWVGVDSADFLGFET